MSGLSFSQEEEKEENEEKAVASDSDKSVDGEDTAAGENITCLLYTSDAADE